MTDDTTLASKKPERDELGRLLPGQPSLNPDGRPKGKSLKDFAREFFMNMSDFEKMEWLAKLPRDIVWRMAEGNPAQDVTSGGEKITPIPIYGGQSVPKHDSDQKDIQPV